MKADEVKEAIKVNRTFNFNRYDLDDIQKIADAKFDGNASMAIRWIIAEWRYLTAKQAALGKRPEREQDHEGDPGGHG